MANVKQGRPICQVWVAKSKCCSSALPVVLRTCSQRFTPGVVGIELHAMPRALAEINLKRVVIRIGLCHQEAGTVGSIHKWISGEKVDWIARACAGESCSCTRSKGATN